MNLNDVMRMAAKNRQTLIPVATGVGGFAVGLLSGVALAHHRRKQALKYMIRTEMQKDLDERMDEAFLGGRDGQHLASSITIAPPDHEIWEAEVIEGEEERQTITIETSHEGDEWNWEDETAKRSPDRPYILTVEEYMSNEMDLRQSTLTWYDLDKVLTDEKDKPMYDVDKWVGEDNLRFGHGSKDQSIVYIRNEFMSSEFEVILDEGSYERQVLGDDLEEEAEKSELKHSTPRFHRD